MWRDPFDLSQTADPGRPRGAPLTIVNHSVNLLRAFCTLLRRFFPVFLNFFSENEHEKGAPTSTAPFFKQLAKLLASNLLTHP